MAKETIMYTVSVSNKRRRRKEKINNLKDYSAAGVTSLMESVRHGVKFATFKKFADEGPFSFSEWSKILHLSDRTMQRYQAEKKTFDPMVSDRILQIAILYNRGMEVFEDKNNFGTWLKTKSVALGGTKPKEILDNTFGIGLVMDELGRIENGILA